MNIQTNFPVGCAQVTLLLMGRGRGCTYVRCVRCWARYWTQNATESSPQACARNPQHHFRDRETEAERSGGFLRSQPVSGGPGITPQVCLTEKSARCSRDHTLLSATGCSAYDLYLPEVCFSVYSLTCKHRASVECPHMCVYVFTLNSSLLFILFGLTHGHLIFPFLP